MYVKKFCFITVTIKTNHYASMINGMKFAVGKLQEKKRNVFE